MTQRGRPPGSTIHCCVCPWGSSMRMTWSRTSRRPSMLAAQVSGSTSTPEERVRSRLLGDRQSDGIVEVDDFLFAARVDYPPEPVLFARLAAVLHDDLGQLSHFGGIH